MKVSAGATPWRRQACADRRGATPDEGGAAPTIGVLILPFTHPRKSRAALRLAGSVWDTAGSGKRTGSEWGDASQPVLRRHHGR